ncbi:hypothetical protein [Candidatus Parabeggiatoa sp. HSG14]|uniref:hypothetical protein n=1 Tax=Candidatus Parabeggiatoa sp. HSG14 TaxID=3055593 RepID=UPI0025A71F89|nr:hypothetical protein [Thiotrichales bacterium HSG14]
MTTHERKSQSKREIVEKSCFVLNIPHYGLTVSSNIRAGAKFGTKKKSKSNKKWLEQYDKSNGVSH